MYHNIAKMAWFNQFLSRIHLVRQQEKGFNVKQCPGFLVSRCCILFSDFSLLENSIFFNVPQYCQNCVVQSIFIEDSSCQVGRKGVFCEIVPWISGFQVVHTIVRLLTFGKQYFLQCTTILSKLCGSINFLSRIHLLRQQEKGFSVKQCRVFLVSRWHILLSDFSLLENSIFFNVPQYCQNRPGFLVSNWCILLSDFSLLKNIIFFNVPQYCQNCAVQSIFIEDSSCQVARKGVFCEIVPRISGFQVAHTIVRLLTFGKQYFLQCTTILPKSRGSINFY